MSCICFYLVPTHSCRFTNISLRGTGAIDDYVSSQIILQQVTDSSGAVATDDHAKSKFHIDLTRPRTRGGGLREVEFPGLSNPNSS